MERPVLAPPAAALLVALALAVPAAARPSSTAADMALALPDEEDSAEAQVFESSETFADAEDDIPPEDLSDAQVAEEDGAVAAEPETSESGQLKSELKRMFMGLLVPAVERRLRKAVDGDDEAEPADP